MSLPYAQHQVAGQTNQQQCRFWKRLTLQVSSPSLSRTNFVGLVTLYVCLDPSRLPKKILDSELTKRKRNQAGQRKRLKDRAEGSRSGAVVTLCGESARLPPRQPFQNSNSNRNARTRINEFWELLGATRVNRLPFVIYILFLYFLLHPRTQPEAMCH